MNSNPGSPYLVVWSWNSLNVPEPPFSSVPNVDNPLGELMAVLDGTVSPQKFASMRNLWLWSYMEMGLTHVLRLDEVIPDSNRPSILRKRQRHTRSMPGEDGGRDCGKVSAGQGTAKTAATTKAGETWRDVWKELSEGVWPCEHLHFELLTSRTLRINVCFFKPPSLW